MGSFAANGYGLFDMAGNLWEWTWEVHSNTWYSQPEATDDNSRGPAFVSNRVLRGGGYYTADSLRCAYRLSLSPLSSNANGGFGFRCVRGL